MNGLLTQLDRAGDSLVPVLARLSFAAVLLVYFWASGLTKLDGLFTPSLGAYAQIFPHAMEAAGFDASQMGAMRTLIVLAGSWAELILPAMIVLGLATRLAALGMIGFVVVQSLTDIIGHGASAATIGAWFDRASDALILDQRALWVVVLLTLVLKGAGPFSLDHLVKLWQLRRP
ncbi:DoxX family protein [Tabrizicola sp.]|uniref:DoxX family protein n=1 Tax=Tabrizicola sp. TaxID=2005166 RepID=UPI003D286122